MTTTHLPGPLRSRHGSAMMETVLVLPFLVFILLLVMFFGRGVARVQHTQVMDRYEAWRLAAQSPGPSANQNEGNPQMNILFFGEAAKSIDFNSSNYFPTDAPVSLQSAGQQFSTDTGALVDLAYQNFARGVRVEFKTSHQTDTRLWQRFEVPITHSHTRLDHDWKFVNGWRVQNNQWEPNGTGPWMLSPPVRDLFFQRFDNDMTAMVNQGNQLAAILQSVYSARPAYVGPNIVLP